MTTLAALSFGVSSATAAQLPDGREYERVSTVGGQPYVPRTALPSRRFIAVQPFRAVDSGNVLSYVAEPFDGAGSGEVGNGLGDLWFSTRTPTGWKPEDITPTGQKGFQFQSITEGGSAIYSPGSTEFAGVNETDRLSPEVEPGCKTLYRRLTGTGTYAPLFTHGIHPGDCGRPLFAGASADESTWLVQSTAALTAGSTEATESDLPPGRTREASYAGCDFSCNLYTVRDGSLTLVNELNGQPAPGAIFGGYPSALSEGPDFSGDISTDASRVFWTDTAPGPDFEHVYAFEEGTHNVAVSGSAPAQFWTATPDGRFAYYTEAGALWRYDTSTNSRERLVGGSAEVQGVVGTNTIGPDGQYLYFVANGTLPSTPNPVGETPTQGDCPEPSEPSSHCNLYLLRMGEPLPTFVARLSSADNGLSGGGNGEHGGDWQSALGNRVAQVTPSGESLAFESIETLVPGPVPPEQSINPNVYVFSAADHSLACASCTQEPENGHGVGLLSKFTVSSLARTYMHHYISENGSRVFFQTFSSLVPADTNGHQDVYEWERVAVPGESENTCTAAAVSPAYGGCLYLLSGGRSSIDSYVVDADPKGQNVFFEHAGALGTVQSPDDEYQMYDARVGGGFAQVESGCTGSSCGDSQSVDESGPRPASATVIAAGNIRPNHLRSALGQCRKKYKNQKKKRTRCEQSARKRYGASSKRNHHASGKPTSSSGRGK